MKVFKFTTAKYHYAYSGKDEAEAKQAMYDDIGEVDIIKTEEVNESTWDDPFISIWEDNDPCLDPSHISIRELMSNTPQLIYTNDLYFL